MRSGEDYLVRHAAEITSLLLPTLVAAVAVCAVGRGDELSPSRLASLPPAEATAWQEYLDRSSSRAAADAAALEAECEHAGLDHPARAPSGGDFGPDLDAADAWFAGSEAAQLTAAVLSFQTPAGGWSKKLGYSKGPRQIGMQWTSQSDPGKKPRYQATFDNGATVTEIEFLVRVWEATERDDCRAAVNRGLAFILDAQYPNGGWPQVYPLQGGYHDNITFNDGATDRILYLLQAVQAGEPRFRCITEQLRGRVGEALDRGIGCVVRCQVEIGSRKTAWCAQHDPLTLAPAAARAYEPASLSGIESGGIVRFLMSIPQPSADVVASIEAGLAWLDSAKLEGLSRVKRDGRTLYVADDASAEVFWARFYDLSTGRPIFPGKDGVTYDSFAALAAANDKLGYDYLSTRPGAIVGNGQKKWRKRLVKAGAGERSQRSSGDLP